MNLDDLPPGYTIDPDGVARRPSATRANAANEQVTAPARSKPQDRSEKLWMARVLAAAKRHGWLGYHTFSSRRSQPGFPDLVLVRDRVVFAELKTDTGRLTEAQQEWLDRLSSAGAEVYVWRPSDLDQVEQVLS